MTLRPASWNATGLVEKAWKRLEPPTQERLAELLGVKRTNLSKLNKGKLRMTPEYAARIVAVVPGLTAADLGAPASMVAEAEPMVLDRLQSLEGEIEVWQALLREGFALLGLQVQPEADQGARVQRSVAQGPLDAEAV